MAFIVETGVGLENANAFATVEFCDGYNATQIDGQGWADEDLADKQVSIVTATQMLCLSYDYHGRRLTRTQALEFPRWGLRDRDGYLLPTAPLPREIKCATAELARVLRSRAAAGVTSSGVSTTGSAGAVEKIQVGPIALTLSSTTSSSTGASGASTEAVALIPRSVTGWLHDMGIPRFGYGSARLVR